ncbi:transcriptional regulator GcvA [Ruegeria sp. HKCCC1038]|uniref:transcriptional regulator GcvA n=1 Tax=Ruegeria sp. HKCCC1038 TaxID=2682982 RepID=UPI00148821C7|nr:transcriptional regulator GcvA [Ruegeria sp. HKCCC1038]
MRALPPLNALRAFEAAARHLNFRLAAEDLGVTQGAVAQQVRGLEARLGVPLFDRMPRGLRLTEDGRRFHAPLKRAFRLIESAVEEISDQHEVTISVTPSFASKWLVPRLSDFTAKHPDIQVKVDAKEKLAVFDSDGVDIAVRHGHPQKAPGLRADPLFSTDLIAVCAPELAKQVLQPSDLLQHVLLNDAHGLWPLYLVRVGVQGKSRMMNFNQTSLAIDAAVAGQGVALANEALVASDLASGRLVKALGQALISDPGFYIVAPEKPRQPKLVDLMRQWLFDQI